MTKRRKDRRIVIWTILIVLLLVTCDIVILISIKEYPNRVSEGVFNFDSSCTNSQHINGEWRFVWDKLLMHQEFNNKTNITYQSVPSMWNYYKTDKIDISRFGYATYSVTVKGVTKGNRYMLRIPTVGTSAKYYIDNKLIFEAGVVAKSKDKYKPQYKIKYQDFIAPDEQFDLIVQVANFDYARAGLWYSIQLGNYDNMRLMQLNRQKFEYFILDIIMVSLLISIVIAAVSKKSITYYFIILNLLIGIYHITTGDMILLQCIPNLSFKLFVKLQYLVLFLTPAIFLQFAILLSNTNKTRIITAISLIHARIFSVLTIAFPIKIITRLTYYGDFIAFLSCIICIVIIVKSSYNGVLKTSSFIVTGIIMGFCLKHDFLYVSALNDSKTGPLVSIGFVCIVISVGNLLILNLHDMKNKALLKENIEQAYLNCQIKPHFLFNTLNTIASTIDTDPKKAEELTLSLSAFLRNIIAYDNMKNLISINKEIEIVKEYVNIEKARFDDIDIIFNIETNNQIFLPPLTLQPIVENAIKHGLRPKKSKGHIKIAVKEASRHYIISIADNGVGMSKNKLAQIRHMIKHNTHDKAEFCLETAKSIGLYNVSLRFKKIYSCSLIIDSEINEGTTVTMLIDKE